MSESGRFGKEAYERISEICSGIENEHEILSCAQLEAQQELSKVVDASAPGASLTDTKVIKRDNIVLGISDLKQKKVDGKSISSKSVAKAVVIAEKVNAKKEVDDSEVVINPINTIKVNNCEIVNRRPRSVTAAIFAHPLFTPNTESKLDKDPSTNKTRAHSATAKIFRQSPQSVTSVTSTIFAPRTKDMNKGFLMFSEDEPGLTSKSLDQIEICQNKRLAAIAEDIAHIVRSVGICAVGSGVNCTRLFTHRRRASGCTQTVSIDSRS